MPEGKPEAPVKANAIKAAAFAAVVAAAAFAAWRRTWAKTYLRFNTMFGKARIYQVEDDAGEAVRLLEVGGIVQSGTYLDERYTELVFEYLKQYDVLFDYLKAPKRICILGCGGYDYPEHLVANRPDVIVDAVEIDPAITTLARTYFYLDRLIEEYETERTGRLNLICDDALHHLRTTEQVYDAIVNDTFDAGTPPAHLTTRDFACAVHKRLRPGGLFLTNVVAALEGPESAFLHEQVRILQSVFDEVEIFPCATDTLDDADNVIVIARKGHDATVLE